MEDYDNQVLQEAQDLCKALNLGTQIRLLRWRDKTLWSTAGSDDFGFGLGLGLLPLRLKGKLEPEEWRPLMAASLIYRKQLGGSFPLKRLFATILSTLLLLLVGAGVSSYVFGNNYDLPFLFYIIVVVGPVFINGITQGGKKLRLQADLLAANVVGRDQFLSVLRKIEGLGLTDVKRTEMKGFSRHFSSKPSVGERIANLSATK